MSTFSSVLVSVLIFSFLIFVHELGHFLAAKSFGVQVNEFSMFMGPALFQKKIGQTVYSLRCIPMGGYCAMEGEDEDTDNPHSFQKAAWWKRLIILVSGAGMNFVVGVLIFIIFMLPATNMVTANISEVRDCVTFQGEQGLQVGDRIVSIDGERVYVGDDVNMLLQVLPGDSREIVVERNGQKVTLHGISTHEHTDKDGKVSRHYGFVLTQMKPTFLDNVKQGFLLTIDNVRNVRLGFAMLFNGQAGLKDMTGAVGLVGAMTDVATQAKSTFAAVWSMLYIGGVITVNLGVMNLLPIPALDGGRVAGLLLTTGIEKITRKKLDPKYEGYVHGIGMIILLALIAIITFKDIFMIFKG
jgi:regulator of sigma E protease